MHSWTGMQNLQTQLDRICKLTLRPCQSSGLEDEFPFKMSHFQGSNCEFTVWINERSSPFIPSLPEVKFVPDDLVRMDKTHRMPVKKKSAFSIRGYLGCSMLQLEIPLLVEKKATRTAGQMLENGCVLRCFFLGGDVLWGKKKTTE